MRRVGRKQTKEMPHEHEKRCSGRVSHVQLPGGGDELTTIPEGRGGLHRKEIRCCCDGKNNPSAQRIPQFKILHIFIILLIFRPFLGKIGTKVLQNLESRK
jgi:hypothetical protein